MHLLTLIDTPGGKRSYEKFKEADAAIVVYDITDQDSFTNAKVIVRDLERLKKYHTHLIRWDQN